ncbi:OmpH family outer membrane protein [Desulfonema magnum]|nr:OmpH family outer membrane protein [Desulfonema magnum]
MQFFKKIFAGTIFLLFFFVFSSYGADVPKIAIVDLQKVSELSSAGKKIRAEITKKGKAMETELKTKATEIQKLEKGLEREAPVMSKEQRESKKREINIKLYDLKSLEKRYKEELFKFQNEKLKKMNKEVFEIVQEIGKKEGYLLIIEKMGVLYAPQSIDITEQLIEKYNAKFAK